jgi:GC-rich sequence DNA-binding factor
VELVEVKREWIDEFRGWVEMLGGFLEEKVSCDRAR